MNKLPIELFHLIFEYLDLIDLLNCKLVNKQFYRSSISYRIKELNAFNNYQNSSNWFCINQSINLNRVLIQKWFLKNELMFNFNFLKRLRIELGKKDCSLRCSNFIIKFNQNLEQLEIINYSETYQTTLDLPKLKVFYLDTRIKFNWEINAPNLQAIKVNGLIQFLKIKLPLSIKYLHLRHFDPKIASDFKNLETLSFCNLNEEELLLSSFSKLNEIIYVPCQLYELFINRMNLFKSIIEKRSKLEKANNLKIYCDNLEINNLDDLNGSNIVKCEASQSSDEIKSINYNPLIESFNNKFIELYFFKFKYIHQINVINRVEDQDILIEFVTKCTNLTRLFIRNSKLDQNFYDQLSSMNSLEILSILENKSDDHLNLNFVYEMFNLISLVTDQQFNLDEKFKLNRFKYLREFKFKINKDHIQMIKKNDLYFFYMNDELKSKEITFEQVLEKCIQLTKKKIISQNRSIIFNKVIRIF